MLRENLQEGRKTPRFQGKKCDPRKRTLEEEGDELERGKPKWKYRNFSMVGDRLLKDKRGKDRKTGRNQSDNDWGVGVVVGHGSPGGRGSRHLAAGERRVDHQKVACKVAS